MEHKKEKLQKLAAAMSGLRIPPISELLFHTATAICIQDVRCKGTNVDGWLRVGDRCRIYRTKTTPDGELSELPMLETPFGEFLFPLFHTQFVLSKES